jgi:hypothetical protein
VTIAVAERFTIVTPLGVSFVDEALRARVSDGLRVRVTPPGGRPLTARANASGTWWVSGVPGLLDVEQGPGTTDWWAGPPLPRITCSVDVEDPAGRYLPCQFDVDLATRWVLDEVCTPPLPRIGPRLGVPLFAAPSRTVPPGMAAVRAQLWDDVANEPAAGAVMEVRLDAAQELLGRGVSDDRGQVLVLLGWPPLAPQAGPGNPDALTAQRWKLNLTVLHDASPPAGLCARMRQGKATLVNFPHPTLAFGRELFVSSTGGDVLLVQP